MLEAKFPTNNLKLGHYKKKFHIRNILMKVGKYAHKHSHETEKKEEGGGGRPGWVVYGGRIQKYFDTDV